MRTFFAAAAAKDAGLLSKCFSSNAPGEFQAIVNRSLAEEDLEEIKACFGNGRITGCDLAAAPTRAVVHILFQRRGSEAEEHLDMVKEGDEWKLLDF